MIRHSGKDTRTASGAHRSLLTDAGDPCGRLDLFSRFLLPCTANRYMGVWPFLSRGPRMKVPPVGIEYVKVLLVSPFNFTALGWPFVSKTSMRPVTAAPLVLTSATCAAHPPPIA